MSPEPGTASNKEHKHVSHTSQNHGTSGTYTDLKAVVKVLKMSFTRHGCEASVFVRVCQCVFVCVVSAGPLEGKKCEIAGGQKSLFIRAPQCEIAFFPRHIKTLQHNICTTGHTSLLYTAAKHSACHTNAIIF